MKRRYLTVGDDKGIDLEIGEVQVYVLLIQGNNEPSSSIASILKHFL